MNEKVSEKKGVSMTVAITLVIICIILLVGLAHARIDTLTIIGLLLLGIGIIMGLGFLLHRRKMRAISEPTQPMPS